MRLLAPTRPVGAVTDAMHGEVEYHIQGSLDGLQGVRVARVGGAYVVHIEDSQENTIDRVATALQEAEAYLVMCYPKHYAKHGPLFTGELRATLNFPPWTKAHDQHQTPAHPLQAVTPGT